MAGLPTPGTAAPDPNTDPWGWSQWAARQDPGTYGGVGGEREITADDLPSYRKALQQAGLWTPEFEAYANWQAPTHGEDGFAGTGGDQPVVDMSSLKGYKIGANRGPGHTRYATLYSPDGGLAGLDSYQRESTGFKDYLQAAMIVGGGAYGMNAAFGGLGGLEGLVGAGGGSTPLNMAAIESGLGTAGYGYNASAAASGFFNPATIGAGAGMMYGAGGEIVPYAADLVSAGGSTWDAANGIKTAAGTTPGTGSWNGTDFTGPATKAAGGGMGWMDIVQAGIGVAGLVNDYKAVGAATDAAKDANALSRDVAMRQLNMTDEQYRNYLQNIQPRLMAQMDESTAGAAQGRAQSDKLFGLQYDDAERYSRRWQNVQVPLEDEIIGNARRLGTQEEQDRIVGLATADTRQAFSNMREMSARDSARRGLNPNSGAAQALAQQAFLGEALAVSHGSNQARFAANDRYRAGMNESAALGRGLPGFSTASASGATGAGTLGLNAGQGGINATVAGSNANTNALNGFSSGWGNAAETARGGVGGLMQAGQLSNNSALSTLAGMGWGNWGAAPRKG